MTVNESRHQAAVARLRECGIIHNAADALPVMLVAHAALHNDDSPDGWVDISAANLSDPLNRIAIRRVLADVYSLEGEKHQNLEWCVLGGLLSLDPTSSYDLWVCGFMEVAEAARSENPIKRWLRSILGKRRVPTSIFDNDVWRFNERVGPTPDQWAEIMGKR